jgi:hypothetical protein
MNVIRLALQYRMIVRKHFSFILFGRYSNDIFGFSFRIGHFVFQYAFGKFGIFNEKTFKWVVSI